MEVVEISEEQAKAEAKAQKKHDEYVTMMEQGRDSDYGKEVQKIIDHEMDSLSEEVYKIQNEEMKSIFLLSEDKKKETLERMSMRNQVIVGAREVLEKVKERL